MPRSLLAAILLTSLTAASLSAQNQYRGRIPVLRQPDNTLSVSMRYIGATTATFNNVGNIASTLDIGDLVESSTRQYNDGYINLDGRTTDDGIALPADGRTNSWGIQGNGQVLDDNAGIAFHQYSASFEGSRSADTSGAAGIDVEYSRTLGSFGKHAPNTLAPFRWGASLAWGFSDVNAKTRETLYGTLQTVTDIYSLLGANGPDLADGTSYTSPGSTTETITNPDGSTTVFSVDNTILLQDVPYSRTTTNEAEGAQIVGYWQIKGAYFSFRTGPWVHWQATKRIGLRLSAGANLSWLGTSLRYDEALVDVNQSVIIRDNQDSETNSITVFGYYASFDIEYKLSQNTAFFIGLLYEGFSSDFTLSVGSRSATVNQAGDLGIRIGLTTIF